MADHFYNNEQDMRNHWNDNNVLVGDRLRWPVEDPYYTKEEIDGKLSVTPMYFHRISTKVMTYDFRPLYPPLEIEIRFNIINVTSQINTSNIADILSEPPAVDYTVTGWVSAGGASLIILSLNAGNNGLWIGCQDVVLTQFVKLPVDPSSFFDFQIQSTRII